MPNSELPKSVVNLSSFLLHKKLVEILSRGKKFIPTPTTLPKKELHASIDSFTLFNKRQIHIGQRKSTHIPLPSSATLAKQKRALFGPSTWKPPPNFLDPITDTMSSSMHRLVDKSPHNMDANPPCDNCSDLERSILEHTAKDQRIIVKPADKGSALVVMNSEDYAKEAIRQLSNRNHYVPLDQPLYPKSQLVLDQFRRELRLKGFISDRQLHWFKVDNEDPRSRRFYLLPKIHKPPASWPVPYKVPPGRPIVSDVNSENYILSSFIDHHLAPLATTHSSYIRDTWDFLSKLRSARPDRNCFLATLDVNSLYTNINNRDGMRAIRRSFGRQPKPVYDTISRMLQYILEANDFEFNNQFFLQISGTAMGKKFAPHYADIYMAEWEREALAKCPKKPLVYFRYLDDIFIVWEHSLDDFHTFFAILNSHHPSITLTYEISPTSVNFLDVTIFKGPNFHLLGTFDTKVYVKPTDTHELLHKTSYHPRHTFRGIVKSQFQRFWRICTQREDFDDSVNSLIDVLLTRGYNLKFLRRILWETVEGMDNQSFSTSPCNGSGCTLCKHLSPRTTSLKTATTTVKLRSHGDCGTTDCIYALSCDQCHKTYVGQTRNLRHRIQAHASNIRNDRYDTPLIQHFNLHSWRSAKIRVLETINPAASQQQRNLLENKWITTAETLYPNGLNSEVNPEPTLIPFITPLSRLSEPLNKIARKHFKRLARALPRWETTHRLLTSHSRRKSIKDHLVKTRFLNRSTPTPSYDKARIPLDVSPPSSDPTRKPMTWIRQTVEWHKRHSFLKPTDLRREDSDTPTPQASSFRAANAAVTGNSAV